MCYRSNNVPWTEMGALISKAALAYHNSTLYQRFCLDHLLRVLHTIIDEVLNQKSINSIRRIFKPMLVYTKRGLRGVGRQPRSKLQSRRNRATDLLSGPLTEPPEEAPRP